ncbi:hypothetical protein KKH36_04290 [Patescibacteria group bacterium]|nr:hypothetical protein [Patescibacteria group bacterium]
MAPLQLKELKEAPRRKGAASPLSMFTGYEKGYAPARPMLDTFIAPSIAPAQPAATNALGQLSAALSGLQPGLGQFLTKAHKDEGDLAKANAIEAARLRENIDATWDEFYKRNPDAPRAMDPRFKMAYNQEHLRLNAQTWGRSLFEKIHQNPDGILDPDATQEQVETYLQKEAEGLLKKFEGSDPLAQATALHPVMDNWMGRAATEITNLRLKRLTAARYETAAQTFTEWVKDDLAANIPAEQIGKRIALHAKELIKTGLNGTQVNNLIWDSYVALATKLDDPDLAMELAAATKTRPGDPKSPSLLDIGRIGIKADTLKETLTNQKLSRYQLMKSVERDRRAESFRTLSNDLAERLHSDPLADVSDLRDKAQQKGILAQFDKEVRTNKAGILAAADTSTDDPEAQRQLENMMNAGKYAEARKLADSYSREGKLTSSTFRYYQKQSRQEENFQHKISTYPSFNKYQNLMVERIKKTFVAGPMNPLTGSQTLTTQGRALLEDFTMDWGDDMRLWLKEYRQEHNGEYPTDLEAERKAVDLFKEMRKSLPKVENSFGLSAPGAEATNAGQQAKGAKTQAPQAGQPPTKLDISLSDLNESGKGAPDGPPDENALYVQEALGLLYPANGARLVANLKTILRDKYDFPFNDRDPNHQKYLRAVIENYIPLWKAELGRGGPVPARHQPKGDAAAGFHKATTAGLVKE